MALVDEAVPGGHGADLRAAAPDGASVVVLDAAAPDGEAVPGACGAAAGDDVDHADVVAAATVATGTAATEVAAAVG